MVGSGPRRLRAAEQRDTDSSLGGADVAEHAAERMVIRATPERCFEAVTDFPSYARWADDVKDVQVLERDGQERPSSVMFRAAAFGRSTTYTLVYDYTNAPAELSWIQSEGDLTSRLDGAYVFEPTADGETDVRYDLHVELRVPIPGFVKRRAEGRITHTALKELKAWIESAET
ncbi:MAG: SRPBCC family protein [Acidimicrobiales bacterium]